MVDKKYYYDVPDIMRITGYKRTKAAQIIHDLRAELSNQGYILGRPGTIDRAYADKRLRWGDVKK